MYILNAHHILYTDYTFTDDCARIHNPCPAASILQNNKMFIAIGISVCVSVCFAYPQDFNAVVRESTRLTPPIVRLMCWIRNTNLSSNFKRAKWAQMCRLNWKLSILFIHGKELGMQQTFVESIAPPPPTLCNHFIALTNWDKHQTIYAVCMEV